MSRKKHVHHPEPTGDALARYERLTNNGSTWFDIMPNPANGVSNVASWPAFDQTNPDSVLIGQPAKLDFPGAFTLCFWASQSPGLSGAEFVMSRDTTHGAARAFIFTQYDSTGRPRFIVWTNPGAILRDCYSRGSYADNQWRFYVGVNEGFGGNLKIYINGVLDETGDIGGVMNIPANVNARIGTSDDLAGNPEALTGRCDTARYYGRALSPDEILRDYYAGLAAHA
jgi:hypothetical protein